MNVSRPYSSYSHSNALLHHCPQPSSQPQSNNSTSSSIRAPPPVPISQLPISRFSTSLPIGQQNHDHNRSAATQRSSPYPHNSRYPSPVSSRPGSPYTTTTTTTAAAATAAKSANQRASRAPTPDKDEIRRISHSAVEKRRRMRINDKIAEIYTLLPQLNTTNINKVVILQAAIDHIKDLHGQIGQNLSRTGSDSIISGAPSNSSRPQYARVAPVLQPHTAASHYQTFPIHHMAVSSPSTTSTSQDFGSDSDSDGMDTDAIEGLLALSKYGARRMSLKEISAGQL